MIAIMVFSQILLLLLVLVSSFPLVKLSKVGSSSIECLLKNDMINRDRDQHYKYHSQNRFLLTAFNQKISKSHEASSLAYVRGLLKNYGMVKITKLIIIAIAATISASTVPIFFNKVLQVLITPNFNMIELLKPLSIMLFLHTCEPMFTIFYVRSCTHLIDQIITEVRVSLFKNLVNSDLPTIETMGVVDITNLLINEIDKLRNTAFLNISRDRGLRAVFELLTGIFILYKLNRSLAIVFTLMVPITSFISSRFTKKLIKNTQLENMNTIGLTSKIQETFSNFKEVYTFSNQNLETLRVNNNQKAISKAFSSLGRAKANFEASNRAGIYANIVTMFGFGGYLVSRGKIPPTTLISFIGYCWSLNFAMQGLLYTYGDLKTASTSWDKVMKVLLNPSSNKTSTTSVIIPQNLKNNENNIITDIEIKIPFVQNPISLSFRNVSFCYPSRPDIHVLNNLNLEIPAGKVTALVGPSGSGKSTIASILNRFYLPTSGNVIIDDSIDMSDISSLEYLDRVSVVRQSPGLFTDTIENNIAYGANSCKHVTEVDIIRAAKLANAHEFIMKLPGNYQTVLGDGNGKLQLSGGQKQRIAIARAILKDSSLLVLDESTSALDSESEAFVQESLSKLMKNRTTVVIAHRLSTIMNADQICLVSRGQVLEVGNHQELMLKRGLYYSLMSTQTQAYNLS